MVFAAKRRGRVCSGAALAVLVALVALALLSRVDAEMGRAEELRKRVGSAVTKLCDRNIKKCDAAFQLLTFVQMDLGVGLAFERAG